MARLMAGHTFRVVKSRVVFQFLMRVMAGRATETAIIGVLVTLAVGQAVGLESQVVRTAAFRHLHYGFPTAMAGAAKLLGHLVGIHPFRVENAFFFRRNVW